MGFSAEDPFTHFYASWKQEQAAARGASQIVRVCSWAPCTGLLPRKLDAAGYSSEEPFAILASKPIIYENGHAAFEAAPKSPC